MEKYLRVNLLNGSSFEECVPNLEPLWTIEGEDTCEIALPFDENIKNLLVSLEIPFEEKELNIDWKNQWSSFACGEEKEGFFEIDLGKGGSLKLKPGPGFGDLSHPTTRLMLKMMVLFCDGKSCIDIGSGSGILSVAAALFGAKEVFACDIDPEAVLHTKECVSLNQMDEKIKVFLPQDLICTHLTNPLILINMIEREQREALPPFLEKWNSPVIISSGIISADKRSYIEWIGELGFIVEDSLDEEGWSAFHLVKGN